MDNWVADTKDLSAIKETDMLAGMWNGGKQAPITANPIIYKANGNVKIHCMTEGASIAYRKKGDKRWEVYTEPLPQTNEAYETVAMRIGYEISETIDF